MDYIITTAVFVLFLLATKYLLPTKKESNADEIPCLRRVPFLGSLPFISDLRNLHVLMADLSKQLGDVVGFYLTNRLIVVLNGRDAIYEALVKQSAEFADRPSKSTITLLNHKTRGIIEHVYDDHFKKYHALALDIMKDFGFGKGIMEDRIKIEVNDLIENIDVYKGESVRSEDFQNVVTESVLNVILSILFGNRMSRHDPEYQQILSSFNFVAENSINALSVQFFPILRWLPKYKRLLKKQLECEIKAYEFMEKQIDGHTDNSFIQEFIARDGVNFERDQLNFTLRDFFAAGMETTVATLQFIFIFLANRFDLQKELQSQMDQVVERNGIVSIKDKGNLALLEAFILEAMRFKTLAPLALVHMTTKDTVVKGKIIPANTWVIPNIYSANMDPSIWEDPQNFRPSRFLDDKGAVINRNLMMSFSLGKRSCFGEIMARQELLLFTGNVLHVYTIHPPQGQEQISFTENTGVVVHPENYSIRFLKRI